MKDNIKKLEPSDNDVLVLKVPKDSTNLEVEEVAQELMGVLRSIDPSPGFLIIPEDIDIENVPERKMNKMGWFRRVDVKD